MQREESGLSCKEPACWDLVSSCGPLCSRPGAEGALMLGATMPQCVLTHRLGGGWGQGSINPISGPPGLFLSPE